MAKAREEYYIVPMSLEQALERLDQMSALGIQLQSVANDKDLYAYRVQRLVPGRGGRLQVTDEVRGMLRRWEEKLTRVEPLVKIVPLWKIILFYSVSLMLGLALALGIAAISEGIGVEFSRRIMVVLIVYAVLFVMLQPQRWFLGSSGDVRLSEFVKGVLSGPYADPKKLYAQYFPGQPYWQRHFAELENRNRPPT